MLLRRRTVAQAAGLALALALAAPAIALLRGGNPAFAAPPTTPVPAAAPAGPTTLPPAATVEEACAPEVLARLQYAPASARTPLLGELDRRIATTLAEERRQEEALRSGDRLPPRALALWAFGAILALAGAAAARRPLAALAFALAAVALLVAGGLASRGAAEARAHGEERSRELVACHLRLVEARAQLENARVARCLYDLGEAAEDLLGWGATLRAGGAVTVEQVKKLHDELAESPR